MSTWNWRVADDVSLQIEHIGILAQLLTPPLTTDGQANAASWQVKEVGCVDGGI